MDNLLFDPMVFMKREQHGDFVREAEHHRLARLAEAQTPKVHHNVMRWAGLRLVAAGTHLLAVSGEQEYTWQPQA